MLSFEEKLAIIESFPQLERKDVSLKRVNFHFPESVYEKKVVVHHLHPNGNGFVFVGQLDGYDMDEKGFVNIRDFSAEELREVVKKSIQSLSENRALTNERAIIGDEDEQRWVSESGETLILIEEDYFWNIYAGLNLQDSFETYSEAEGYLLEEGFTRK